MPSPDSISSTPAALRTSLLLRCGLFQKRSHADASPRPGETTACRALLSLAAACLRSRTFWPRDIRDPDGRAESSARDKSRLRDPRELGIASATCPRP